jgi:hypothetical protein
MQPQCGRLQLKACPKSKFASVGATGGFVMHDDRAQKSAENFEQFWKEYLIDHAEDGTRALHFLGTAIAIGALIIGVITFSPFIAVFGIGLGYLLAWSGHLLIEGNRPTMLRHPLWSLLCDLRMFRLWLSGQLKDELGRG